MQVQVHDVEAHVARPRDAHERVQVRAVHVHEAARLIDAAADLGHLRLEDPQGVRVREHHARDPVVERRRERVEIRAPLGVRGDLDDFEAGEGAGGRIRPVRRVGHQHPAAVGLAVGPVVRAHEQDAGHLALGAGRRLEAHRVHSRDLLQPALQLVHQP